MYRFTNAITLYLIMIEDRNMSHIIYNFITNNCSYNVFCRSLHFWEKCKIVFETTNFSTFPLNLYETDNSFFQKSKPTELFTNGADRVTNWGPNSNSVLRLPSLLGNSGLRDRSGKNTINECQIWRASEVKRHNLSAYYIQFVLRIIFWF